MGVTGLGSIEFYRSYSCPSRRRPSPDFGAFIEIKEGVDGLIHVSDMSWTKKINHGKAVLPQGQAKQCPLRGQEGSVIIAQICCFLLSKTPENFYVHIYLHREIRLISPKVVGSNPAIPTNSKTRSFGRGAGFFALYPPQYNEMVDRARVRIAVELRRCA
jgi:hypothetical protein